MDEARTLDSLETLLGLVEKALRTTTYRNAYEATNAVQSNLERVVQAEQGLRTVAAHVHRRPEDEDRVLGLQESARRLRGQWEARSREVKSGTFAGLGLGGGAMGGPTDSQEEWLRQIQEEDAIAQDLDRAITGAKGKKAKKGGAKEKAGHSTLDSGDAAFFTKETQRDFKAGKTHGMERGASLAHMMHPTSEGDLQEAVVADISTMKPKKGKRSGAISPQPAQPGGPVGVAGMYGVDDDDDDAALSQSRSKGQNRAAKAAPERKKKDPRFTTLETHKNVLFAALPPDVLRGPCDIVPIENTPFVEMRFQRPTPDPDGEAMFVHATVYRIVVAALHRGIPEVAAKAAAAGAPSQPVAILPPSVNAGIAAAAGDNSAAAPPVDGDGDEDERMLIVSSESDEDGSDDDAMVVHAEHDSDGGDSGSDGGDGDDPAAGRAGGKRNTAGGKKKAAAAPAKQQQQQGGGANAKRKGLSRKAMERIASGGDGDSVDDYDVLQELSQQLVARYTQVDEAAEAEAFFISTGRDLPTGTLRNDLSHFSRVSTCTWCILMCHGGYFAGAIYENTKPIVHKAFHRYVVRKKQGGKQSSHDKGGGSMSSAGGQIRRHHELKWKATVRDILCAWREYIDRSWMILFVAPGPENRSILTDFSELPVSMGGGKMSEASPVSLRDTRVRSVPMTTHRPTFKEVQRIYEAVSRCTLRFVRKEGDSGDDLHEPPLVANE